MRRLSNLSQEELKKILYRYLNFEDYINQVKEIVEYVRKFGDKALIELTKKFDGIELDKIEVSFSELKELGSKVSDELRSIIDQVITQVKEFNSKLIPKNVIEVESPVIIEVKYVPIENVGIYVPRNYVSTLIMTAIPAKVAGVENIYVCTPPLKTGNISPEMAYTAYRIGVKKLFKVGGAQAIAAMAFGTETIPKVDKIIGPGNIYVQTAKLLVSPYVGIDGFEGPTELVVYIDSEKYIVDAVFDTLAQIEHGRSSIAIILSTNEKILNEVEEKIKQYYSETMGQYITLLADNVDQIIQFINSFAPEHLVIYSDHPKRIVSKIKNTGVTSINTPSPYLDYVAGPSHVLPTNLSSKWRGLLTPIDFMKPIAIVEGFKKELIKLGIKIAEIEGFKYHRESLRRKAET